MNKNDHLVPIRSEGYAEIPKRMKLYAKSFSSFRWQMKEIRETPGLWAVREGLLEEEDSL